MMRKIWCVGPLLIFLLSCNSHEVNNNGCEKMVQDRVLFIGSSECLSELPSRTLRGIWVLGPEYSVFYDAGKYRSEPTWLEVPSLFAQENLNGSRGQIQAYEIKFVGSISERPGLYGHFGQFSRGGIVKELLNIRKMSAVPPNMLAAAERPD